MRCKFWRTRCILYGIARCILFEIEVSTPHDAFVFMPEAPRPGEEAFIVGDTGDLRISPRFIKHSCLSMYLQFHSSVKSKINSLPKMYIDALKNLSILNKFTAVATAQRLGPARTRNSNGGPVVALQRTSAVI